MRVGKVYLVGAGPGPTWLLTLRAHELIGAADVLIYDRLIQQETLAGARADAELIYVGKASGRHEHRQEEINELLVAAAHRAALVVRLKNGDPVLFGRGAEEALHLAAHGVPFEVVPGVTAALAAPMAAGIPITHRDAASTVALVAGHRGDGRELAQLDWAALARLDTIVFLMGVGKLPEIAQRLMANGRAPSTPAAVVQQAYWPGERLVVGALRDLPELARAAEIRAPATIIIGDVVALRDQLTTHHRDLRPDDGGEPVDCGLMAEGLLQRLGGAQRGAKDVRAALALRLFDDLEEPLRAAELAARRGLAAAPLAAVLARLAALGLLWRDQGGYRNSEAASRHLRSTSPEPLAERLAGLLRDAEDYDPLRALQVAIDPGAALR